MLSTRSATPLSRERSGGPTAPRRAVPSRGRRRPFWLLALCLALGVLAHLVSSAAPTQAFGPVEVPSLSDFGILALVLGLVGTGFFVIRALDRHRA